MIRKSVILILAILCLLTSELYAQVAIWIVRPKWDSVELQSRSLVKVENKGKYGLIRYDGSVVVDCLYDKITSESEGYCLLLNTINGKKVIKGIVSSDGNKMSKPSKEYAVDEYWPYYSEGMLAVQQVSDGLWGYINYEGELAIECSYLEAYPFSCDLASVRFSSDGCFGHIDKRYFTKPLSPMVSLGSSKNLKKNDYKFVSSFVNTPDGPMAFVICRAGLAGFSLISRDLDGNEGKINIAPLEWLTGSVPIKQKISTKRFDLIFNDAWQPVQFIDKNSGTKQDFEVLSIPAGPASPKTSYTTALSGELLAIQSKGRPFLDYQFDAVLPLSEKEIMVEINKQWGMLSINQSEGVSIAVVNPECRYNHWNKVSVGFRVFIPGSIASLPTKVCLLEDGKERLLSKMADGSFVTDVHPEQPDFKCRIDVGDLKYAPILTHVAMQYSNAFRVSIPTKVDLDANEKGVVKFTVTNSSQYDSGPCSIYFDNNLIDELEYIEAKKSKTYSRTVSVKLGSEDFVTKAKKVEVREANCDPYAASQQVKFCRTFENN